MIPGMELMSCPVAVPASVMQHVVRVESSFNPYAIGVVGGRLLRQPKTLAEALATVKMLESRGYNFSLGLAQVNRYNLAKYGLDSYEKAFDRCPNLLAGSRILAECHSRSGGDWGKSFSCYYSGNFTTGFRHGYVQKVYASMYGPAAGRPAAIPLAPVPGLAASATAHAGRALDRNILNERIVPDVAAAPAVAMPATAQVPHAVPAQAMPAMAVPAGGDMYQSRAVAMALPTAHPVAQAVPTASLGQAHTGQAVVAGAAAQQSADRAFVF